MDLKSKAVLMELLRDADDLDFVDINYHSSVGKIFRLFDRFDMLDLYVTPVAKGFEERAKPLEGFKILNYFVLSKEDIIISKLGRYAEKDQEDIAVLVRECDHALLNTLIKNVIDQENFSERVKVEFVKNSCKFKEKYNV